MTQFATDPKLWGVAVKCILLSLVAFTLLFICVGFGLEWLAEKSTWATKVLVWGGWIASFLLTLVLFPALFGLVGGWFYETVADAVDARHYPNLPPADGPPLSASLNSALRYFVLMLVLNALALPLYLTLLLAMGTGVGVYLVVNGVLFGREHYDAVVLRRATVTEATQWRKQNRGRLAYTGGITALLGLVPFLNLIAPLIGIAAMTHVVNCGLPKPTTPTTPPTP